MTRKKILDREAGMRVRELREAKNITRSALAERMEISISHLALIERGERGLTAVRCEMLKEILNVSIHYLITGRSEPQNKN